MRKVNPGFRNQFDDMFMDIVHAYISAVDKYMGDDAEPWDSQAHVFLWMLFHVKMLIMGPKREKSTEADKTINECVARRLNLFKCEYIEQ